MTSIDRRAFLKALLVAGCGRPFVGDGAAAADEDDPCGAGALEGATFEGIVPFADQGSQPFEVLTGEGLDGRLYTDHGALDETSLVTPNERFYVRTRTPDLIDYTRPWIVRIADEDVPAEAIARRARPMGVTLLECSGNSVGGSFGLMSAADWSGVPLLELLPDHAARVLVSGFDEHSRTSARSVPGASWVFSASDLARTGAFLATAMNGVPLPADHGFPVRLVVPGWYGCTCIKWVDRVALVSEDEPATAHMKEFASRTHQRGVPELARDFAPANIELAAMPVRVERWRALRGDLLRVVGVTWGGEAPATELSLSIGDVLRDARIRVCRPAPNARTWALWEHVVLAPPPGRHAIRLHTGDPAVPARRLDAGFYERSIVL